MLRILITPALLLAVPFVAYFIWREIARRSGRPVGSTPFGWLVGAGCLLVVLSLVATVALRPDNRGEVYVPAQAQPGGGVAPAHFQPR